jgi:hypothetical protein
MKVEIDGIKGDWRFVGVIVDDQGDPMIVVRWGTGGVLCRMYHPSKVTFVEEVDNVR